jgi:hypothetical protein
VIDPASYTPPVREVAVFVRELPEQDAEAVRFVSGLGTLPTWARALDGFAVDLLALSAFVGLVVWIFWLW